MTVLQRIAQLVALRGGANSGFEQYYSRLLENNGGAAGAPSAREARRDLNELRALGTYYPYL